MFITLMTVTLVAFAPWKKSGPMIPSDQKLRKTVH